MKTAGVLLLTLSIFSCYYKPIQHTSPVAPAFFFQRVPISDWPALEDDGSLDDLKQAVSRSLFYLKALPAGKKVFFGAEERPAAEIKGTLDR
ncbi:MAG: hypothetical protein HY892_01820, partial [Deltaproteobacteria bacterium]|nr:hypothetical protein [Deltaproteobacteria bacterium]